MLIAMNDYLKRLLAHDTGASAILIALSLVVLFGFAAVALDATGLGFNERRQAQSAADVGALAAVQFAVPDDVGNPACTGSATARARCNGATEAIEVANLTLDNPALADWGDAAKCSTPPSGFTATSVSPCVAFNSNLQRAWVRVPTIENPTTLARAIGISSVATSASAIAGAGVEPPGGVLPFLLPGNASSSNYACLKAFPNPDWGPCESSPVSGNFGSADFYLYGNVDKGWTSKCSGDTNGRLVANIARGVDHPLSTHATGSGSGIVERDNCPIFSAQPNVVDSQTGVGSGLEQGLVWGGSAYSPTPYPGKIWHSAGTTVRDAGGPNPATRINDDPLWNYLIDDADDPSLSGTPCDDDNILGASPGERPSLMDACITYAKTSDKVIFNDDLAGTTRFGWVPHIWEATFSGNPYYIRLFRPVYLDTTWYSCSSNSCDIMHTPGVPEDPEACPVEPDETRITCGMPGDHNMTLQAVTSWILDPDIVPDNAKTPTPGSANQRTYALTE